jgi:hypothetical protein
MLAKAKSPTFAPGTLTVVATTEVVTEAGFHVALAVLPDSLLIVHLLKGY